MKTREFFDNLASELDSLAWGVETAPWAEWAWGVVEEELGTATGWFIVDLGCGTGAGIENLARFSVDARILGVDYSERMLEQARRKSYRGAAVEFRLSRLDRLRLPEGAVNCFISSGTFHHVKNKRAVLERLAPMLRPGGRFLNLDFFRPGPRYQEELRALRLRCPEAAAENDRVRESFQWIYEQDTSHPIEFHTDPYEFARLVEAAGLGAATVHVSLQPDWAVVSARKPGRSPPRAGPARRRGTSPTSRIESKREERTGRWPSA